MKTVTMLEFRRNAAAVLRRLARGERLILSHRGKPAARLEPFSDAGDVVSQDDPALNLDRWEKWGRTHPGPIREWRARILSAQSTLQELAIFLNDLRKDNIDSDPLKSCSPSTGLEGAGRA